jgi:hypothetical protein
VCGRGPCGRVDVEDCWRVGWGSGDMWDGARNLREYVKLTGRVVGRGLGCHAVAGGGRHWRGRFGQVMLGSLRNSGCTAHRASAWRAFVRWQVHGPPRFRSAHLSVPRPRLRRANPLSRCLTGHSSYTHTLTHTGHCLGGFVGFCGLFVGAGGSWRVRWTCCYCGCECGCVIVCVSVVWRWSDVIWGLWAALKV